MGAIDIAAKVRSAALAAVERQCFGEDFGVIATAVVAPTPTGGFAVLHTLVVSTRSPLLGQGPLVNVTQIQAPDPTGEQVEQAVTGAMKGLRELSSKILNDQGNTPALGGTFRP
jgi:hypothetical protein